jgi:NAD(P)-dependent dehydrogenase (short-subunit alcohol dehydrogenase family)
VERLKEEFADERVGFVATDVSDGESVARMVAATQANFGPIDIVLNNATFAPAGLSVVESPITYWDRSYAVNLRGPVLLARACLPSMLARGRGVFACVSSTGVTAFTIGPGLVATATAAEAIERVAPRLGLSLNEFYSMNRGAMLSTEAAGAGFAAAVALVEQYAGQEISSSQALIDAGIDIPEEVAVPAGVNLAAAVQSQA